MVTPLITKPQRKQVSASVFNEALYRTACELNTLLSKVKPEPCIHKLEGVLTAVKTYLPAIIDNLKSNVYLEASFYPKECFVYDELPPGLATILFLVAEGLPEKEGEEAEGMMVAATAIRQACVPQEASPGKEPLTFKIARKAYELSRLLKQVPQPDRDKPYGGYWTVVAFSLPGLARNLAEGVYICFRLVPTVKNQHYFPPTDWAGILHTVRNSGDSRSPAHSNGVRWACAKYRDLFKHIVEPVFHCRKVS